MTDWLPTVVFASLAGISRQAANRLLARIDRREMFSWQNALLETRVVSGRGGRSGQQYLVKVSTLPPHLQERLKALQTPVERLSHVVSGSLAARERTWWLEVLGPALNHSKGSQERKAALSDAIAKPVFDWNGRRVKLSLRTLQRKLERMEGEGSIRPLARYGRSDKGAKRVFLSRRWDEAVPLDDEVKAKIAGLLQQEIRSYIKAGLKSSQIALFGARFLAKASSAHGFRPTDPDILERICAIPKSLISAEMHYRKVYRHLKDRKASEDDAPRIKRTIKGMRPMDEIVMDVHPIDVFVRRNDGTLATPKLLAFLDVATQRVWCELIFFDSRGGVRNVDLIEAFVAMARHPSFGLPKRVYCDNGKEYGFADFLNDAMQLVSVTTDRRSTVTHAQPYNAAAKPIEQLFRRLEQLYLSNSPGYVGGDRMNQRQEAVGRAVAPFEGGFAAFKAVFFGLLRAYEAIPQLDGQLDKRSPKQVFESHVKDGWAATVIDPDDLLTVFTRPEIRAVRAHSIDVGGRTWTGPELDTYFGEKVTVRVPVYHGFNELLLEDGSGNRIGIVKPQEEFAFHDVRGAQQSASRKQERNKALAKLGRSVPDIDPLALLIGFGAEQTQVVPNDPIGTVSVGRHHSGRMIVPSGSPGEATEAERRRERKEIQAIREQRNANVTKRAAS